MSLKEYLENLEIGEEKLKLLKEDIKGIMAEHGKVVTTETDKVKGELQADKDTLNNTIKELKEQIEKAPKSDELDSLKTKIADYEKQEQERKEQEEKTKQEEILNANVLQAIGDTEFVNDRTKNAIISEIKTALLDKANLGKSAKDIFNELTKDTTDILKNPNEKSNDMPDMKDVDVNTNKNDESSKIKFTPMFQNFN